MNTVESTPLYTCQNCGAGGASPMALSNQPTKTLCAGCFEAASASLTVVGTVVTGNPQTGPLT